MRERSGLLRDISAVASAMASWPDIGKPTACSFAVLPFADEATGMAMGTDMKMGMGMAMGTDLAEATETVAADLVGFPHSLE